MGLVHCGMYVTGLLIQCNQDIISVMFGYTEIFYKPIEIVLSHNDFPLVVSNPNYVYLLICYLLTGELWSIYCEHFGENWLNYNSTKLYSITWKSATLYIWFIDPSLLDHQHRYYNQLIGHRSKLLKTGQQFADAIFKLELGYGSTKYLLNKSDFRGNIKGNPWVIYVKTWINAKQNRRFLFIIPNS